LEASKGVDEGEAVHDAATRTVQPQFDVAAGVLPSPRRKRLDTSLNRRFADFFVEVVDMEMPIAG
jgi:hypothetical protein